MNFKLTAICTAAILCAASAVSCGKDKDSSSSDVILDINTTTSSTETTSESEETTTTTALSSTTGKKDDKKTTTTTAKKDETVTTKAADETEVVTEVPKIDPDDEPDVPAGTPAEPQDDPAPPINNISSSTGETFSTADIDQPISVFISELGGSFMQSEAPEACIPKGDAGDILFVYEYPDIKFECYSNGGIQYVYDIVITGGDHSTDKGIKVGSSRAEVMSAYGSLDEFNGALIASGSNSEIYFVMSGDTVSEIQINSL
jgi:hypothetical protein